MYLHFEHAGLHHVADRIRWDAQGLGLLPAMFFLYHKGDIVGGHLRFQQFTELAYVYRVW